MTTRKVPNLSLLSYVNGSNQDQVKFVNDLMVGLKEYGFIILKDHLDHCIVHAVEEGDTAMLDEFNKAIDKFVK